MQCFASFVLECSLCDIISNFVQFGAAPIKFDNEKRGPEKCEFCNKTVYPTERVHANGKTMHKQCFRCCECQTVLKLAAFAFNGGKFYWYVQ